MSNDMRPDKGMKELGEREIKRKKREKFRARKRTRPDMEGRR